MRAALILLSLLAPASALVAHTLPLRTRAPAVARAAPAEMMLGSRSFGQLRKSFKLPTLPKGFGRGGIIKGSDGGDGAPPSDGATASSGDSDDEPGPLVQAWKNYESLLDEKPLLMKALTSFTGFAIGDILAQLFIQKCDPFDWARLFRLASFGFFVHGTTSHWFYGMLDGKIPGTSAKVVFSKVFIDQVRAVTANKASLPATPQNSSPSISHPLVPFCVRFLHTGAVEPVLRRHVLRVHRHARGEGHPIRHRQDAQRPRQRCHGLVEGLAARAHDQLPLRPLVAARSLHQHHPGPQQHRPTTTLIPSHPSHTIPPFLPYRSATTASSRSSDQRAGRRSELARL